MKFCASFSDQLSTKIRIKIYNHLINPPFFKRVENPKPSVPAETPKEPIVLLFHCSALFPKPGKKFQWAKQQ